MNQQEIFNKVARHLARQGRKATDKNGECSYRGKGGLKCAVGCLIRDSEYRSNMEGESVFSLVRTGMLPTRLKRARRLLARLQSAHDDNHYGDDVARHLHVIARQHRLSAAVLKKLRFPEHWA
jgi:hypothetical protein